MQDLAGLLLLRKWPLRRKNSPIIIHLKYFLIEKAKFGLGVAYNTNSKSHILNTRAGLMSIFQEDKDHFVRWAQKKDPAITSDSFVARQAYGDISKLF